VKPNWFAHQDPLSVKKFFLSLAVLRIRIRIRMHMFLGLLDPNTDPFVTDMNPDSNLDRILRKNNKTNLDFHCFGTFFGLFTFEN
jgi:hypothetical protein